MAASVLQLLVDERLGAAGPWHRVVDGWRADGDSWEVSARRLRAATRLEIEHGLTGETLRRWSAKRAT